MDILRRIPFDSNQAVVFDIDDTLIDSATHKPIQIIVDIYFYCLRRGYKLYIITARPYFLKNVLWTLEELQRIGLTNFKLKLRPGYIEDIARWKMEARETIPENVIMSLGDQPGDMGKHGGVGILVIKDHNHSHRYMIYNNL